MAQLSVDVDWGLIAKLRDHEIEEARVLHRALVPEEPLRAGPLEVASLFRPADCVGGDFLDYFCLSDGRVGLYVGDVVGKGLPAALYAALAVGTLRGIHKTGQRPSAVLALLNSRLRTRALRGRYCAVQYALFDHATRQLCFANAGLPGPLHLSARGCNEPRSGGLPSGLFDGSDYAEHRLELQPGDSVLFFTDGVTDARNTQDEEFGLEGLLEVCSRLRSNSAAALLEEISAAVDEFAGNRAQHDDMAAVMLRLRP